MGALLVSVLAAAGTSVGALVVARRSAATSAAYHLAFALGAGLLLAAVLLGLLPEAAADGGAAPLVVGLLLGAGVLAALDRVLPEPHGEPGADGAPRAAPAPGRLPLLVGAVALHNLPEGAGVGLTFAGGETALGTALAVGIFLHNVPMGIAVALPLRARGRPVAPTVGWATAAGLVGVAGAMLAFVLGSSLEGVLPWGLAFAGGALLYVVLADLLPAALAGSRRRALVASAGAFAAMAVALELVHAVAGEI